ncbi:MAG: hypothetical protein V4638_08230 [Bacteroidota bacterium]
MKRKFLAYLVLSCLFFLSVPKGLWHQHEELASHDEKKSHLHDTTSVEEDCFICDFDMSAATEPPHFAFNFSHNNNFAQSTKDYSFFETPRLLSLELRGPPAFIS